MPEGGVIGYHCLHEYPVTIGDSEIWEGVLKGRDKAFMATMQTMGLKTEIYALWNANAQHTMDYDSEGEEKVGVVFSQVWQAECDCCVGGEYGTCSEALNWAGIPSSDAPKDVKWINERRGKERQSMTVASYGNEPSTDTFYHTGAIVVHIPAAKERNAE